MCGIIGIIGTKPVAQRLIQGLKNLEYRGYDSAGIAVYDGGVLKRVRSSGKICQLEKALSKSPYDGNLGIAHTRWATHGEPVENNAHPHMNDEVAVVHNGIIENYVELKKSLQNQGYIFTSETDTEVLVHLITDELKKGCLPLQALQNVSKCLKGTYALAILFKNFNNIIAAMRHGSPLALGYGDNEMFLGSDALALAPFSNSISYLEDGDIALLAKDNVEIYDVKGACVNRKIINSAIEPSMILKGNYRHYMQKEIYEQPEAIAHSLAYYIAFSSQQFKEYSNIVNWKEIDHISFSGCGTAFYSTLVAKYWFETYAGISVDNDIASEFRYRDIIFRPKTLALFVSQSGETADSLASLRYCKEKNIKTAVVVNVNSSSMAREADYVFQTFCGPEIGVASTKAFTSQLSVLLSLAIQAGCVRGYLPMELVHKYMEQLAQLPSIINHTLKTDDVIKSFVQNIKYAQTILYLGRGTSYPIALEGALKLKELSYLHAEGYAAGELKHGPIALIEENVPIIVVAPFDKWFEKTMSNMQEVLARGGSVTLFTDEKGASFCKDQKIKIIIMPTATQMLTPIIYAIPIQLIAYHTAVQLGTDVDQPRNLAKSVTVE